MNILDTDGIMRHGTILHERRGRLGKPGSYGALTDGIQAVFHRALVTIALVASLAIGPAAAETIKLVALGDSLTAGYQLPADAAFPVQLEAALRERGHDVELVNAGVSGDTASAGLARLDWSVPEDADGVIVELGANDALRGLDPAQAHDALQEILTRLTERGQEVLLAGMLAPPNLGEEYGENFAAVYSDLAERFDVVFYPFFLDGVAMDSALNLEDGMHPNEAGVTRIVERILPAVEELIERIKAG